MCALSSLLIYEGFKMRKDDGQTIQAFPIEANTFIGVASNEDVTHKSVVHASVDGSITFTFPSGNVAVNVKEGTDLAIGAGCQTITSTAEVLIS